MATPGRNEFLPPQILTLCCIEQPFRDKFIWELYNEITEKSDHKRVDDWNALADAMLLFVRCISYAQSNTHSVIGCLVCILSFCVLDRHNGKS
jgi:hypothetical protein